jgi:hypothetical protein
MLCLDDLPIHTQVRRVSPSIPKDPPLGLLPLRARNDVARRGPNASGPPDGLGGASRLAVTQHAAPAGYGQAADEWSAR